MTDINIEDMRRAVQLSGLKDFDGNFTSLGGGEINDTFLLNCGKDKAVLRVAKHLDQNSLHQEAKALGLLNSRQVPKLIFFDADNLIQGRQWIMESYVHGKSITRLNIEQFKNFGKLLAQVHGVRSGNVGVNIWSCFLDECKMFGDEKTLLEHTDIDLRELIGIAYKYFQGWQPKLDSVPESLIHGDATPSNILVNNSAVSLIDWEFSKFKDPMAEFSTIFYEDMEYNQGKWRVHITREEKDALFEGYANAGGLVDYGRLELWMNFDKLGAAVFLYWRLHQSTREASKEQKEQYKVDLSNLKASLTANLVA